MRRRATRTTMQIFLVLSPMLLTGTHLGLAQWEPSSARLRWSHGTVVRARSRLSAPLLAPLFSLAFSLSLSLCVSVYLPLRSISYLPQPPHLRCVAEQSAL